MDERSGRYGVYRCAVVCYSTVQPLLGGHFQVPIATGCLGKAKAIGAAAVRGVVNGTGAFAVHRGVAIAPIPCVAPILRP